ncbi:hypothetical protein [Pseudomonas alabamensis]|uniref:hypothetical protein n=1 Tax=Pseudomonas alabamensis TaxID=3064349 RepID=UPI000745B17F|nr:hypothetical protein APT63_08710 [Pseudomonas monteilii]
MKRPIRMTSLLSLPGILAMVAAPVILLKGTAVLFGLPYTTMAERRSAEHQARLAKQPAPPRTLTTLEIYDSDGVRHPELERSLKHGSLPAQH